MMLTKPIWALLSVSDPTGLLDLARSLAEAGIKLIATEGTKRYLSTGGLTCQTIEEVTGQKPWLGGRIKTLHPRITGGILARRQHDQAIMADEALLDIRWVVVNLYPYEQRSTHCTNLADTVEWIDIGGETLLRAAAKNYQDVVAVCDPNDYHILSQQLKTHPMLDQSSRSQLATKVWRHMADYNQMIALDWQARANIDLTHQLQQQPLLDLEKKSLTALKYGENKHQRAWLYHGPYQSGLAQARHAGSALSYNNLLDADYLWRLIGDLKQPACAISKHNIPCGVAWGKDFIDNFYRAVACDRQSAFGGIYGFNHVVDESLAEAIIGEKLFIELIIAPSFSDLAWDLLRKKKSKCRLLAVGDMMSTNPTVTFRSINGGMLIQEKDLHQAMPSTWQLVSGTEQQPSQDLQLAWIIAKHTKSNAISLVENGQLLGLGAGFTSRVAAAEFALLQAKAHPERISAAACASDGFFPFVDALEKLAEAGIRQVAQPGGSKNDESIIAFSSQHHISMWLTGLRHFLH